MFVFVDRIRLFFKGCVIMAALKEYLLSITAAAIICVLVRRITTGMGSASRIIKVITGLFMSVTLISPLIQLDIDIVEEYFSNISYDADHIAAAGYEAANEEMNSIIINRLESYILDEAMRLGTDLEVEVKLSDSHPPQPERITIQGSISPYDKRRLMEYITKNLGVPQENQIWK